MSEATMRSGGYELEGVFMPDDPALRTRPRWDGTITLGNVVTVVVFVGTILIWSLRLEGRVNSVEREQQVLSARLTEDRGVARAANQEIKAAISRLDDKLTQYLLSQSQGRNGNNQSR